MPMDPRDDATMAWIHQLACYFEIPATCAGRKTGAYWSGTYSMKSADCGTRQSMVRYEADLFSFLDSTMA
jgi:hypothetical protein